MFLCMCAEIKRKRGLYCWRQLVHILVYCVTLMHFIGCEWRVIERKRNYQKTYITYFLYIWFLSVCNSLSFTIHPLLTRILSLTFYTSPSCFSPSLSLSLRKQAEGQQLCPLAVSCHPVAMVYGALFAGLYVGLPWQGLFAILNVWQHCTDADDKHPTSHFDQWNGYWLEEMVRCHRSI